VLPGGSSGVQVLHTGGLRAALTAGPHQECQRRWFSARVLHCLYKCRWEFFVFSGHTVGRNSVSCWKLDLKVSFENSKCMTNPFSMGFPQGPGICRSLLECTVGYRILISWGCQDSASTIPGTSEVMGMRVACMLTAVFPC